MISLSPGIDAEKAPTLTVLPFKDRKATTLSVEIEYRLAE